MPHVIGVQLTAAEKLLTDIGLQASNETVQSPRPKGLVLAQDPADGTKVPKGSTVTLRVSSGTGEVKVPAVEGQNLNDAVATVVRAGLVARRDPGPVAGAEGHGHRAGSAGERAGASGLEGAHERLRRAGEHLHADPDGHDLGDHDGRPRPRRRRSRRRRSLVAHTCASVT